MKPSQTRPSSLTDPLLPKDPSPAAQAKIDAQAGGADHSPTKFTGQLFPWLGAAAAAPAPQTTTITTPGAHK